MSPGMIVSIKEADVVPGNSSGHHSHNIKYLLLQCLLQPRLAAPHLARDTARGRHCTLHLNIVLSRKAIVAAFRLVTILRERKALPLLSLCHKGPYLNDLCSKSGN